MTTLMLQYEIQLDSDLNEWCSKVIHTECVFRKIDYKWEIWRGCGGSATECNTSSVSFFGCWP